MVHTENCRCFDCVKEVVKMIMPGGQEVITEMVVIRTDAGDAYLCQKSYEGPVLMLG